jgi:protein disulfide-isomerase A1
MTRQALPAVSILTSETIEEFKTADKVVLVAFLDPDDRASNRSFSAVADSLRDDFLFGIASDAALAKAEGVKQPGIILYKDFDEGKSIYQGKFDVKTISEFAKTASTPLVGEVGPSTYLGYMAVSRDCYAG